MKIHIPYKNVIVYLAACICVFVLVVGILVLWMISCCKIHLCICVSLMLWSVQISILAELGLGHSRQVRYLCVGVSAYSDTPTNRNMHSVCILHAYTSPVYWGS